jgi:DNA-directed RNA polymerase subunit N (RpoN/RPB10)
MIPLTCPTCGYFLGNKVNNFEKEKEKICENAKISEEAQGVEIQKLIKSLNLRRYCCIMRLMSSKDIVQDILPIASEE